MAGSPTKENEIGSRVRQVMARAMKVERVPEDARRGEFEPWDSLGHLLVVDALEAEFSVRITPEDAMRLDSISSIEQHLVESDA